jgi:hypothetical protein
MTNPEESSMLSQRVDQLETGLAEVRSRAETAETLARLADRDTAGIKASHAAIIRSMSAWRTTQVEQGMVLADHTQVLADLRAGISTIIGLLTGRPE